MSAVVIVVVKYVIIVISIKITILQNYTSFKSIGDYETVFFQSLCLAMVFRATV